jgi:hypothetical protein
VTAERRSQRVDQEGPADLVFRAQPGRRIAKWDPSSSVPWLVIALVSAVLFVLTIRVLLERTAWTAGGAKPASTPLSSTMQPASPISHMSEPMPVPMVYRCVDASGGVSLQSQPCGPGQRTTRAVPAPPEREPIRPRTVARSAPSSSHVYNTFHVPQADPRAAQWMACAAARQNRDATLARVGLKRTYDLLQQLDAAVNQACKGL